MPNPPHYKGQYERYETNKPQYVFQEWPKAVTLRDGTQVIAQHQADELRIVAEDTSDKAKLHPAEARADELALALLEAEDKAQAIRQVAAKAEESKADLQRQLDEMSAKLDALVKAQAPAQAPAAAPAVVVPPKSGELNLT